MYNYDPNYSKNLSSSDNIYVWFKVIPDCKNLMLKVYYSPNPAHPDVVSFHHVVLWLAGYCLCLIVLLSPTCISLFYLPMPLEIDTITIVHILPFFFIKKANHLINLKAGNWDIQYQASQENVNKEKHNQQ
jgi:hypothetical protein